MAPVEGYIFLDKNSQFLFLEENSKTEQCKRLSFDTKVYLFHFHEMYKYFWMVLDVDDDFAKQVAVSLFFLEPSFTHSNYLNERIITCEWYTIYILE